METIADVEGDPRERVLLVLLPPAYGSARDFADHGFVSAIRSRGLPVDMIAAGAIADHYLDETVVARLHADVIAPARAKGYRSAASAACSRCNRMPPTSTDSCCSHPISVRGPR